MGKTYLNYIMMLLVTSATHPKDAERGTQAPILFERIQDMILGTAWDAIDLFVCWAPVYQGWTTLKKRPEPTHN